jgi:hypothetical protein
MATTDADRLFVDTNVLVQANVADFTRFNGLIQLEPLE